MSEHDQQKMVVDWLDANRIKFFAPQNAAKRSPQMAAKLKAEGMRKGVCDLIICDPPPLLEAQGVTSAALEMKDKGKKPTDEQIEWIQWFNDAPHWIAGVYDDAGLAVAWLQSIGYGRARGC